MIAVALVCLVANPVSAKVLSWDFQIDEAQIKNGPEMDGSTDSPGTGTGHFEYDTSTNVISYELSWNNLFGELTKLHLHGPADASSSNPQHIFEVFGPPDIPAEVDLHSDTWSDSLVLQALQQTGTDPTTGMPYEPISPATIVSIMESGQSYVNVHTNVFGMGEIRGSLGLPVATPEPSALCLLILCGAGMSRVRLRRCR